MKKVKSLLAILILLGVGSFAQAQESEISDENLRRYALLMETVDAMKADISVTLNGMIKNQEGMTGKRYSELKKGEGEAATEFEQKFMDNINGMVDERKEAISMVLKTLATKMLPDGGKAYKAIQTALKSDEDVKARYETILARIQTPEEGA